MLDHQVRRTQDSLTTGRLGRRAHGYRGEAPGRRPADDGRGLAGYMRKASFWPATFGLACCAIEMMTSGGPRYDLARFGMEVFRASPRQADLMIVAGRVSQKMAPVLRQIYDQMAEPKYVLAMGVCASSGGMFNNYAILQGVDHVVPVDMYLPGCPPRPEMLIDAILKLHEQVQSTKLGVNRMQPDRGAGDRGPQRAADLADEGPAAMSDSRATSSPRSSPRSPRAPTRTPPTTRTRTRCPSVPTTCSPRSSASAAACSGSPAPATPPATAAWCGRSRCPAAASGPTAAGSTRSRTRSSRRSSRPARASRTPRSRRSWCTAAR